MSKTAEDYLTLTPVEKTPGDGFNEDVFKERLTTEEIGEELSIIRERLDRQKTKSARLTQQIAALKSLVIGAT